MEGVCPFCKSKKLANLSMNLPSGGSICYVSCLECKAIGPAETTARGALENWIQHKNMVTFRAAGMFVAIRNCVFCGEEKKIKIKVGKRGYHVECARCKSSGPDECTPFRAVNVWNSAF